MARKAVSSRYYFEFEGEIHCFEYILFHCVFSNEGNRWLRPQRPNEKKPLDLLTYPKKKEREATNYFQIFECCNHFSVIRGESSAANKIQVTLLTSSPKESETRPFDPRGVASSIGMYL